MPRRKIVEGTIEGKPEVHVQIGDFELNDANGIIVIALQDLSVQSMVAMAKGEFTFIELAAFVEEIDLVKAKIINKMAELMQF